MTLNDWIQQLPENWDENNDFEDCAICHEDEVWDFNICIACAEDLNENGYEEEAMEWDSYVLASAGWGTDEDYGYYGE